MMEDNMTLCVCGWGGPGPCPCPNNQSTISTSNLPITQAPFFENPRFIYHNGDLYEKTDKPVDVS